jgi:hypothetical protein
VISRRTLLSVSLAAPAIVAAPSLMKLRGIRLDPLVRFQSWPIGTDPVGEWWTHTGPLSRAKHVGAEMKAMFGECHFEFIDVGSQSKLRAYEPICGTDSTYNFCGTDQVFGGKITYTEDYENSKWGYRGEAKDVVCPWPQPVVVPSVYEGGFEFVGGDEVRFPSQHADKSRGEKLDLMCDKLEALTQWKL